jgi:hypothetical protein
VKKLLLRLIYILLKACIIGIAFQNTTVAITSDIEKLIINNEWKSASRAIFLEAASENTFGSYIPIEQAKAGFLEDALDTIASMQPNMQSNALISLTSIPSILNIKKNEIAKKSLDTARQRLGKYPNFLLSGDFARIAFYYSRNNEISKSQMIFYEAIKTAKNGLTEEGSGGYTGITEAMLNEASGNRSWMISLLIPYIQREKISLTSAIAYSHLAKVAIQLQRKDLALKLI